MLAHMYAVLGVSVGSIQGAKCFPPQNFTETSVGEGEKEWETQTLVKASVLIHCTVGIIPSILEPLWGEYFGTVTTRGFAEVTNELGLESLIQFRGALILLHEILRMEE